MNQNNQKQSSTEAGGFQRTFILRLDAREATRNITHDIAELEPDCEDTIGAIEEQLDIRSWEVWQVIPNTPENRTALRAFLTALEQDAGETVEASLLQHAEAFGLTKTETWENPDETETCSTEKPDGTHCITIHSEVRP